MFSSLKALGILRGHFSVERTTDISWPKWWAQWLCKAVWMCENDTAGRGQAWQLSCHPRHGLHFPLIFPVNRRGTAGIHIFKRKRRRVFMWNVDRDLCFFFWVFLCIQSQISAHSSCPHSWATWIKFCLFLEAGYHFLGTLAFSLCK